MRITLFFFFCLVISFAAYSQDPVFSQFYATSTYINPSLSGLSNEVKLSTNYRKQWVSSPANFTTYAATAELPFENSNSSLGIQFINDQAGENILNNTTFNVIYSHKLKINNKWQFRGGIQAAVGQRSINSGELVFEDQLALYDGVISSSQENLSNERRYYPDFSAGFSLLSKKIYLGLAMHHLNRPLLSFVDEHPNYLEQKNTLHGGVKMNKHNSHHSYYSPNFIIQQQGENITFSIGNYFKRKSLTAGMWYRIDQAVIFSLGVEFNDLQIGYSSDFSVSNMISPGMSHEISIAVFINRNSNPRTKREELVFCPTF